MGTTWGWYKTCTKHVKHCKTIKSRKCFAQHDRCSSQSWAGPKKRQKTDIRRSKRSRKTCCKNSRGASDVVTAVLRGDHQAHPSTIHPRMIVTIFCPFDMYPRKTRRFVEKLCICSESPWPAGNVENQWIRKKNEGKKKKRHNGELWCFHFLTPGRIDPDELIGLIQCAVDLMLLLLPWSQWSFKDPKMEALAIFCGYIPLHSPYIALT